MNEKIISVFIIFFLISCGDGNQKEKEINDNQNIESSSNVVTCSYFTASSVIPEVEISGTVHSKNKVDLFSEVSGKVYSKNKFKVGNQFRKGQTLVKIQASDLRLEIKSIKSEFLSLLIQSLPDLKLDYPNSFQKWNAYVEGFSVDKRMRNLPEPENKQLRNLLSSRGVYSLFYKVMSLENKLDKFSIKAPFDCIVTQSFLTKGSNVLLGQKLGQIIDKNNYEISTSLGISDSELFEVGDKAILSSDNIDNTFFAKIKRKGKHINTLTQSIDVFFDVSYRDVKDGMFVKGKVLGKELQNVYKIPRNKIIKNKSVYIKKDSILNEKEVEVIYFDNDSVVVRGLENKDCVIENYRSFFYDGMKIN